MSNRATLRRSALYALAIAAVQAILVLAALGQPVTDYSAYPAPTLFDKNHQTSVNYGALAVRGQYAYVLANPYNIATTNPRIIRTFAWNASPLTTTCADETVTTDVNSSLTDVVQQGSWLYVAVQNTSITGNSIKVYGLADDSGAPVLVQTRSSDPYRPRRIRLLSMDNGDGYLLVEGHSNTDTRLYCYALDGSTGAIDTVATSAVSLASNIYDVAMAGNTAVIADVYGYPAVMRIRGISYKYPEAPVVGAVTTTYNIPMKLAVGADNTTVIVGESVAGVNAVRSEVFRLQTDQYGPTLSHLADFSRNVGHVGFACYGPLLFVGAPNAFVMYDVTNPTYPVALPPCCDGEATALYLVPYAGSVLATGNAGEDFAVFRMNVAAPIADAETYGMFASGSVGDVLAYKRHGGASEYCYVAHDEGLAIMHVAETGLEYLRSLYEGGPALSLAWGGTDVVVLCQGNTGARVLDVGSSPDTPSELSHITSSGAAQGAAIYGNRLYLAAGSAGVEVYDITNPSSPSRLWTVSAAADAKAIAVRKQGDMTLAYVACGASGMKVINVTSAGLTNPVGQVSTTNAQRLVLRGNYAYIADRTGGVRVVNITTYSNPMLAGPGIPACDAVGVALAGEWLYVADSRTVHVYSVASPETPAFEGFLDVGVNVHGLAVTDRVWAAGATRLYEGYVQTGTKPNVIPYSEYESTSYDPGTGAMIWSMWWRSYEWSDPDLLESDLWDGRLNAGCTSYGSDPGALLSYGSSGVETEVVPAIEGGFRNTVRFNTGGCAAVCNYWFRGRCAVLDGSGYQSTSSAKQFSQTLCIE